MSLALISNVVDKLMLITAFSLIAQCFNKAGLFSWIASKSKIATTPVHLITFWFTVAFLLSGVFNDMTIAALLIPLVVACAEQAEFPRPDVLVMSTAFGISTGGDLTVFGGNDNLLALGMLQGTPYGLDKVAWSAVFAPCTVLIGLFTLCVCLWAVRQLNWERQVQQCSVKLNMPMVFSLAVTIVTAFFIESWLLLTVAIVEAVLCRPGKELLRKLPYKAMGVWTAAYIVGQFLAKFVAPELTIPNNTYLLVLLLIVATNLLTNTALMSAALPFIIASGLPASVCYAAIKAVNVAYITIYGNSCLAVAGGYGLKQKDLLKYGLPILAFSFIAIILCF